MTDAQFDLRFDGRLLPDADPNAVRQQLGALFKLDAADVARLFTGQPVFIRRAVNVATAAKFERVFAQAGAVLTIVPSEDAGERELSATPDDSVTRQAAPERSEPPAAPAARMPSAPFVLAPQDGFLENPVPVKMPELDLSYLSLVSNPDWTLADCAPTVAPAPVADLSHLALAAIDTPPDSRDHTD